MSSNGNEKRSAESKHNNSRRNSVGREVTDSAAPTTTTTTTSSSPSTEQPELSEPGRGSQQERGVARRCYPIQTETRPGAEAVRGPDYNEEDEEGTVIIGERSEVVESDEIVTARLVDVDREEDLHSRVESLQEQLRRNETVRGISFKTRDQPPKSILPESPPLYGREEELKKLGDALGLGGRMAALVGGAGMGKTHCASHFAQNWLQEDAAHRFVLWLESDTENVIRISYLKALETMFGREVPDSEEEMSIRDLARLVWQALGEESTQCEWLVVYNNVPEVLGDSEGAEAFSPLFFPTPLENWGRGRILLTTRSTSYGGRIRSLGNHHVTKVPIEPLKECAAVEVLMDNLEDGSGSVSEMDVAKKTVELLGYMPLAIVTANSLIVAETLTVSEYLDDLKTGLTESGVHDAVSLSLANALTYARNHGLSDVLEVAAFLNPDRLTLELLGCDRRTARCLCRLSLLHHSGGDVYTMHRLHQEAAMDGVSPRMAIAVVNQALTRFDASDSGTWNIGMSMIPQLDSLEKNVAAMAEKGAVLKNNEYASLLRSKAQVLHLALHDFQQARSYYQQSLEMQRCVYGPDTKNMDLATTLSNFGLLEWQDENHDEACMRYMEALDMKRHVYGPKAKNVDLATALDDLGALELELFHYGKARIHCEESLDMKRHVYGPEVKNADLIGTLSNLAYLEDYCMNYDKSRLYFQASQLMFRHVNGPNASLLDWVAAGSRGKLEKKLGSREEARSHFEQVFEMQRRMYGPETKNTDLAATLHSLGVLEMQLRDYDKARLHLEEALEMKRHVYGPEATNSDLAQTLDCLEHVEKKLREFEEARSHFEQALETERHAYGPEAKNADLAFTLGSLGNLEKELGNHDKARSYYEEALEMQRHVYGPDAQNADIARTLDILGKLEEKLGNYDKARDARRPGMDIDKD